MVFNKLVFLLLTCGASLQMIAQNDSLIKPVHEKYVSFNGGIVLPVFSFSPSDNTSLGNNGTVYSGGCALPGYNINLSGFYQIGHSKFGVSGVIGYIENGFDMNAFMQAQTMNGFVGTPISHTAWKMEYCMPGIAYLIGKSKLQVELNISLGIIRVTTPEVSYSGYMTDAPYPPYGYGTRVIRSSSYTTIMSDLLGVRAIYKVNANFCLNASADFILAGFQPSDMVQYSYTDPTGNDSFEAPEGVNVLINLLHITAGVGYYFEK